MAAGASGSDGGIAGRSDASGTSTSTGQSSQTGASGAGDPGQVSSDGIDQLLELFAPEKVKAADDEDTEDTGQEEGLSERARRRIQNLSGRSRKLKEELQGLQGKLGEYSQWSHQAYQTMQQQHNAMLTLQQEVAALRQGYVPAQLEPEPTDEVGKFKQSLKKELLGEAEGRFSPQVQAALDAIKRLETERDADRKRWETQQRRQTYNTRVDRALEENFKSIMDPEVYQNMKGPLGGMVLSLAQVTPEGDIGVAAKTLVGLAKELTRGMLKAHRGKVGAKVAESNNAPVRMEGGRSGTSKDVVPTMAQLKKNGFKNYIEWGFKGRPPLR